MRRFIKNIALFSIPFWAFVVYLLSAPYSKEYAYQQIQKDCRSGSWIHQRLFENEQEIDLAFVGTSRTMCGVQDVEIEKLLASQYGRNLKVANLGVCRNGMNLHYLISRDLFQQKKAQIPHSRSANPSSWKQSFPFPLSRRSRRCTRSYPVFEWQLFLGSGRNELEPLDLSPGKMAGTGTLLSRHIDRHRTQLHGGGK